MEFTIPTIIGILSWPLIGVVGMYWMNPPTYWDELVFGVIVIGVFAGWLIVPMLAFSAIWRIAVLLQNKKLPWK